MKKIFLLMLFSFIATGYSFAQPQKSNLGTDFYVAFGKNNQEATITNSASGLNVELILRIATSEATQVTLTFTASTATTPVPPVILTLPADTVFDYILTQSQAIAAYTGVFQSDPATYGANKKSIRVTATKPIKLVAVNSAYKSSFEATLVWPVESWGTEYYNIGFTPLNKSNNCDGYIVIAKEDNTTVTGITGMSGINGPITLNKGEVYFYYMDNKDKLGEHITSNNPVAVFNSNTRAMIYTGPTYYQENYNFEQLAPVSQWGTEFILPTNKYQAGVFRVYTKDASTVLKYTFTDGTPTNTVTITNPGAYDIRIDGYTNTAAKACYLTSSSPVGICAFQVPNIAQANPPQIGAPASAWLPSVKQMTRNVIMSPLDLAGQYAYMAMNHYLTVIVHSSSRNSTTIALNGNAPQPAGSVPNFNWVANNIGGSDYSFGIFKIDSTFIQTGYKAKNKTVLVDNPDGLIALAFSSEGSYATYYYTVGSSYRDLSAGFTVNGVDYADFDEKGICNTSDFTFKAYPDTLTNVVWNINGALAGAENELTKSNLPDGYYTVDMIANGKTYTTHFFLGGIPVVWTPATAGDERYNWDNPSNWTPALVPTACNNVFIPGNLDYYPNLTSAAACNKIYFMQGAELGRPDLLTYEKAYVHYNFGLTENRQETGVTGEELVLSSFSTYDRMLYSAVSSTAPIERERWYMLSEPLKDVVTGDFGFGGYPLTFLKKFGPVIKDNKDYSVGTWTTTYNTMVEPVAEDITDGFAFYMYEYGNDTGDNTGCEEIGYFGQSNEMSYLPDTRDGTSYGLAKTNGILELPFFADSMNLYAHRTQVYDGQQSTFYYILNDQLNTLSGRTEILPRNVTYHNDNYRFAPEHYDSGSGRWVFQNPIQHTVATLGDNDEFLVGNPYMSAIDMVQFLIDNSTSVYPSFRIWNGNDFIDCTLKDGAITATDGSDLNYVVPLQGFFLTYTGKDPVNFDVESISTVIPVKSSINLRSAEPATKEENILRIKAENSYSASYAIVGYKEGTINSYVPKEDVRKLFSPNYNVPSVYSLKGEIPVDINFINNTGDIVVPLGIKTNQTGEIKLTFTGMDNYFKASKIELIDALANKTIDLTGKSSYVYSFNNTEKGISNGRFSLRISSSITALTDVDATEPLNIYGNSKGIYIVSSDPVQKLEVYDLAGRKLYESYLNASYYPLQNNLGNAPLIVKVMTNNSVKTAKIN